MLKPICGLMHTAIYVHHHFVVIYKCNPQRLFVRLSHTVSSKQCVVEKSGKQKNLSSRRENSENINFSPMCVGSNPSQLLSYYFLYKDGILIAISSDNNGIVVGIRGKTHEGFSTRKL
jgi:hypothetical protein